MKIHWGHKLIIVFLLFAGFIIYIFSQAMGDKYEMVTQNYYEKEMEYEKEVNQNARADKKGYSLGIIQDEKFLFVQLDGVKSQVKGEMFWYKPDDGTKDMNLEFVSDSSGKAVYPIEKFEKGMYQVRLTWQEDGKTLALKETVFVQK